MLSQKSGKALHLLLHTEPRKFFYHSFLLFIAVFSADKVAKHLLKANFNHLLLGEAALPLIIVLFSVHVNPPKLINIDFHMTSSGLCGNHEGLTHKILPAIA